MSLRTIIIDDEPNAITNIRLIARDYCPKVEVIGEANNILDGMKLIKKERPDLLFLDVEMPNGSGFDLLEAIDLHDTHVIFITAYSEYAIQALRSKAVDYILKPVDIDEFVAAIDRLDYVPAARGKRQHEIEGIAVPSQDGLININLTDILWLEASGSYTNLHLEDGTTMTISRKLGQFDDVLPKEQFMRIRHSAAVNLVKIKEYNRKENNLKLHNGAVLEISRRKKEEFLEALQRFVKII